MAIYVASKNLKYIYDNMPAGTPIWINPLVSGTF